MRFIAFILAMALPVFGGVMPKPMSQQGFLVSANKGICAKIALPLNVATAVSAAGGTTLLLDESGLGSAAAAYSVRKLRSAYSGSALRVRRSSDSVEADFGFINNELTSSSVSSNPSTRVTAFGNAQIDTAQSKYGGASGLFDGTGDYLSATGSSDFSFGTGDLTLEFWIRFNVAGGRVNLFSAGSHSFFITPNTGNVFIWRGTGILSGGSTVFNTNQWYHIAVTRSGNNWTVWRDGSSYVTSTNSNDWGSTGTFYIGNWGGSEFPDAWIDDYRITKGVARYTGTFTPPTAQLPDGADDPYWSSTKLLLHMNGTDGSTTFTDSSLTDKTLATFCSGTDGFVVTWYDQSGNGRDATQATASLQPKIVSSGTVITGSNSKPAAQGDGSDDRLVASFTLASGATCHVIFNATGGAANYSICDGATGNTQRIFRKSTGGLHRAGADEIGATSFSTSTWYLDSFVRNGASSKFSINAGSDETGTCNTTAAGGVTLFNFGGGGAAMAGKIHEYVVWASALSDANRTTARSNQNTYFSLY